MSPECSPELFISAGNKLCRISWSRLEVTLLLLYYFVVLQAKALQVVILDDHSSTSYVWATPHRPYYQFRLVMGENSNCGKVPTTRYSRWWWWWPCAGLANAHKIRKVIIYFCNKRCEHVRRIAARPGQYRDQRWRKRPQSLGTKLDDGVLLGRLVGLWWWPQRAVNDNWMGLRFCLLANCDCFIYGEKEQANNKKRR